MRGIQAALALLWIAQGVLATPANHHGLVARATSTAKASSSTKKATSTSSKKASSSVKTSTIKPSTASASATAVCNPKGTAAPGDAYWLQNVKHQGTYPFNPDAANYKVFRNVKDFGAKGDGKTDDTAAINNAIMSGNRCFTNCQSTTTSPALVYFPSGTYVISTPLLAIYLTQLVGDAINPPTLLAASSFKGLALIDALPYVNGAQYTTNMNNFFRMVRNFVIDTRQMPASANAKGIHWQVAQGTSLENIVFQLSAASGTQHVGLYMESGSGGWMSELTFNGGLNGMLIGNQQYTARNITINNAVVGINALWNWGWTFQSLFINNCKIGMNITTGVPGTHGSVGGEAIIDVSVINTPVFVRTSNPSNGKLSGSIVLNNIKLQNVPVAVAAVSTTVLAGTTGSMTITAWAQGNVYSGTKATGKFTQGAIPVVKQDASLLDSQGRVFYRARPQYKGSAASQIISAKSNGCKGDGKTDDTAAIRALLKKYGGCAVIFFDAGVYLVNDTVLIPAGTQMVGEAWSTISGYGPRFNDGANPRPVIQVGAAGSSGTMEISDMFFTTIGPAKGAIVMEWNVHQSYQGSAGIWDSHIRLGGAAGTKLEVQQCPAGTQDFTNCASAFLSLHLTKGSSAYIESLWAWNADHELDQDGLAQISLFSGRGILSESQGPVWMVGTASEHHALYQYSLVNATNHYMGMIQTETPYYQPSPVAPNPFTSVTKYGDPVFSSSIAEAWGLYIRGSSGIYIFGADIYNFFKSYTQQCLSTHNCQNQIVSIGSGSAVNIASLATIGSNFMLSVDDTGVIPWSTNQNGFQQTATYWSSGVSNF